MFQLRNFTKKIAINIVGYEFSSSEHFEDLGWLIIKIYAKDENYNWKCSGPFLRISELFDLKQWFISISDNGKISSKNEISFMEQELSFKYYNQELSVIFDYSFHPLGDKYDWINGNAYIISFQLRNIDIKNIVNHISESIKKYKR